VCTLIEAKASVSKKPEVGVGASLGEFGKDRDVRGTRTGPERGCIRVETRFEYARKQTADREVSGPPGGRGEALHTREGSTTQITRILLIKREIIERGVRRDKGRRPCWQQTRAA
jgi:hypothetical protein